MMSVKRNVLNAILSISIIFCSATVSASKFEALGRASDITEIPCPAIERFNIAESVGEIYAENTTNTTGEYSENDILWLSRIIEAEASGESYHGKIAVGNCVINRTKSSEFPNTIYDVIFDKKHGVQYQPIANGAIYNTPSEESVLAAKEALSGYSVVGDALYFCSVKVAPHSWASKNRVYLTTIGNHVFFL